MGFALMASCAKAAWAMVRMSHQLEKGKSIVMMMMENSWDRRNECTYTNAVGSRASGLVCGRLSPVGCVQTDTGR